MKSQALITIVLIAIILVSCAPISTPDLIGSTSTNAPQPTATFTLEPTATFTPEPTVTFTPEPTATFTPEPTNTPELFDVQVLAFWDYNGNGVLDETEPLLEGVVSKIGNAECVTNGEGNCLIDLPKGRYTTKFSTETAIDPNGVAITNLNYLFVGTDVLSLSRGYSIHVDTHMQIMAALGQGQIAVPVSRSSVTEIPLDFLDIGPYGKHYAIDYMIGGNGPQKIYASISGKIDDYPFDDCNVVSIIVSSNFAIK